MTESKTTTLSIISITNNYHKKRPRTPLVQLIGHRLGDIQSLAFSPNEALLVAKAIVRAAKASNAGRKIKPQFIEVLDV